MLDETQRIIVRQCAFKGAIESLPDHVKWINKDGGEKDISAGALVDAVKYLTDAYERIILNSQKPPVSS